MSRATFMLCAGGTGGHLFPAQAVGEALVRRGHRAVLAVDRRAFAYLKGVEAGFDVRHLASRGMKPGLTGRLVTLALLGLGYVQAHLLILRHRPAAVIGFGGYPSLPPVLAARHQGRPILLFEQNAVLGRANRWLAAKGSTLATAFEDTLLPESLKANPQVLTGNPVRSAIAAIGASKAVGEGERLHLLVTGGSQGARVFAELVPEALAQLQDDLRRRLRLSLQAKDEDGALASRLHALGIEAEIRPFFDDMPARLAAADLAICRAGASTLAELAASATPAILIPYPHAMDDHQRRNAERVADAGAGWLMAQDAITPETLADRLEALLTAPQRLAAASRAAAARAYPDAAERLADLAENIAALREVRS